MNTQRQTRLIPFKALEATPVSCENTECSSNSLAGSVVAVTELSEAERNTMFRLYDSYYDGALQPTFERDLAGKHYVVVLRDGEGMIRGFSTLAIELRNLAEPITAPKQVRIIYSGDTIIERSYWGQNQFSKTWLELAGFLKAEQPDIPLYWLLIVKGHRTYRYLSIFCTNYFPRYDRETPEEFQQLMHQLAAAQFGSCYDAASGLVFFPQPRSYLSADLADIPDKDKERPDVQYFLRRNPGYRQGDELLCVCEFSEEKLTRLARKWFNNGRVAYERAQKL